MFCQSKKAPYICETKIKQKRCSHRGDKEFYFFIVKVLEREVHL